MRIEGIINWKINVLKRKFIKIYLTKFPLLLISSTSLLVAAEAFKEKCLVLFLRYKIGGTLTQHQRNDFISNL